ncbi:stathmin-3-like [Polymixia lowei]
MTQNIVAYTEKIKEMSVMSLICSCLYPQPTATVTQCPYEDMEVKPINKCLSGQSFEVILKSPTDLSPDRPSPLPSPPRKDISLDDLQRRLEAAEERRKSQEAQVLRLLAERREHEREVLHKAVEGNNNFSKMAEKKLNHKMEVINQNRETYLNSLKQKLREKEKHAVEVRRNKELQADLSG